MTKRAGENMSPPKAALLLYGGATLGGVAGIFISDAAAIVGALLGAFVGWAIQNAGWKKDEQELDALIEYRQRGGRNL